MRLRIWSPPPCAARARRSPVRIQLFGDSTQWGSAASRQPVATAVRRAQSHGAAAAPARRSSPSAVRRADTSVDRARRRAVPRASSACRRSPPLRARHHGLAARRRRRDAQVAARSTRRGGRRRGCGQSTEVVGRRPAPTQAATRDRAEGADADAGSRWSSRRAGARLAADARSPPGGCPPSIARVALAACRSARRRGCADLDAPRSEGALRWESAGSSRHGRALSLAGAASAAASSPSAIVIS